MLPFCIYLAFVTVTAGRVVDEEFMFVHGEEAIQWPEKYTVKTTKMSLTTGLVTKYTIWRTENKSRLDNGYVTTVNTEENSDYSLCEVHPETDEFANVKNECSCMIMKNVHLNFALDGLPDVNYNEYQATGNESVTDREATKFEYQDDGTYYTLWATYSYMENGNYGWVPVRYELKKYNNELGFLADHEITDYYEFSTEFDEDVFKINNETCESEIMEPDRVIKELMFVDTESKHHVDQVFNSFKNEFDRKYTDEAEHNFRRNIFKKNMRLISVTNRQDLGYKLAVNRFADRTPKELRALTGLKRRAPGKVGNIPFPYKKEDLDGIVENLPREVDLRLEGIITPVQNQGDCGSCWTFGTTSAVEGALARINGGRLLRLSNQALIDCAWGFGASGCNGGTDNAAYEFMMEYGLPTIEEYGNYEERDGYCHIENVTMYPIKGYTDVTAYSNIALKVALFNHGPLSVSVEVNDKFKLYSSGIFYDTDCSQSKDELNHEVTLVGYGEKYGELFWILKNSWGANWGEEGYMLISAKNNNCGVTIEPTYVVL